METSNIIAISSLSLSIFITLIGMIKYFFDRKRNNKIFQKQDEIEEKYLKLKEKQVKISKSNKQIFKKMSEIMKENSITKLKFENELLEHIKMITINSKKTNNFDRQGKDKAAKRNNDLLTNGFIKQTDKEFDTTASIVKQMLKRTRIKPK
ncbi:hypothetical protein [Williamsoniiplasma luminosum]|uniref:Uncharacterized protein n=1 Tax=Williamsoniiplasma luminosum TaxID=214888 RepID=A0A2S0NK38_9MOLU|nr:hypothetical protein [Williamsoniiplasma luminosum]AVP49383.1 MAG: hypothetical protein C5T88_02175 [Williamsoniiplasma luminosum]